MAISRADLNQIFSATRGRPANENEFRKFKDREYEELFQELDKPFEGQEKLVRDLFIKNLGREPNQQELDTYKSAPLSYFISDISASPENKAFNPLNDQRTFEEYEAEQRPLIEKEYEEYYGGLLSDLEKEVERRRTELGEDKETAIARALEDKNRAIETLSIKQTQLEEDRSRRSGRLTEDVGTSRERLGIQEGYLAADETRDIGDFERQADIAREQRETSLNQRGLVTGSAFDQGGVAGNLRQRQEVDLQGRLEKVKTGYERQRQGLGQQRQDIDKGFTRGSEDLATQYGRTGLDINRSREDVERGFARGQEDLNRSSSRNTYELEDYLEKKRKALEEQRQKDIADTLLTRAETLGTGTTATNTSATGASPQSALGGAGYKEKYGTQNNPAFKNPMDQYAATS